MALHSKIIVWTILLFPSLLSTPPAQARLVEYQLIIAEETLTVTDKPTIGMTINGSVPGPTLHFKEGDTARILVHNKMNSHTSIHWHGLLVPPGMDGVPYVSFPPIAPGDTFTYAFPIRQSGTYWYHSHSSMQEQRGLYGAIVIAPDKERVQADRDYVVLLSDWTDENPHAVNRTLKRDGEWYPLEKGSGQSIFGAARVGRLGNYFRRELQRMPAMDIADVAYDRFLVNGSPVISLSADPDETVHLRFINGSATTYFYLDFAGGPMTIVAADGQNVEPIEEKRFLIGVAETYDVIVHIPSSEAHELRATAHDGSGITSIWLGTGKRNLAPAVPKPDVYQAMNHLSFKDVFAFTPSGAMGMTDRQVDAGEFDQPGMMGMTVDKSMESMPGMTGHAMDVPKEEPGPTKHTAEMTSMPGHTPTMPMKHSPDAEQRNRLAEYDGSRYGKDFGWLAADASTAQNVAMDGMSPLRPWPPYHKLRAIAPTAFPKDRPIRKIRLTLDGDMERYIWSINNRTLSESDVIRIHAGEVVRFILINRTMMHHPMHLHGHFFRVINGQGDYAPLKHTVNVAPMSTTVIEFSASEVGDWFFHCHLLYHMENGMARVVHYQEYEADPKLDSIRSNLNKDPWTFLGEADALSNMTSGSVSLSTTRNIFMAEWEVGWQDVDTTQWEGILTANRYINRFFNGFIGADRIDDGGGESTETRGIVGFNYLLPFNIESRLWADSDGGARVSLEKKFDLTPRLSLEGEVQYDSHEFWEGNAQLAYMVSTTISVIGRWHSEYGVGAGIRVRF